MNSKVKTNIQIQELILFIISFLLPVLFGLKIQSVFFASIFFLVSILLTKFLIFKYVRVVYVYSLVMWVQIVFYFFILWNYSTSITLGSFEQPYIRGDAGTYFLLAKELSEGSGLLSELSQIRRINYIGYPLFLGFIFKVFYADLLVGMLFSMFAGVLNIVLITYILKLTTQSQKITFIGALLSSISPHLASTATIILKDVFIISSLLIIILSALLLAKNKKLKYFILLLLGLIIIAFLRLPYLVLFLAFFFIIFFQKTNFKNLFFGSIIVVAAIILINITSQFSAFNYFTDGTELLKNQTEIISNNWNTDSENSVTGRLVFGYQNWSFVKKTLFLPIFTAIQYLHPFNFWDLKHEYPWHYLGVNMNLIWLLFLGPLVIFTFLNLKKIDNILIVKLLIISGIGYVFIAYTYGGTIPRYSFPFLAVFFIGISYVYANNLLRQRFKIFLQHYWMFGLLLVLVYSIFKFL